MTTELPRPPASLVINGQAQFGRYAGLMERFDWAGLESAQVKGSLWQKLHHKKWLYVGLGTDEVFVGVAIVSLGWCQTAFAYVFDRRRKRMLVDWSGDGLPGLSGAVADAPVAGARAWFKSFGSALSIEQTAGGPIHVLVKAGGIKLDAQLTLAGAPPFLLAVGPIEGGAAHATQKSPGLQVVGWLDVAGKGFNVGQGMACLDSSNGLLARNTDWRWACAQGDGVGFNLQNGYFQGHENALWLDGHLIALGAARFEFDPASPLSPWRVSTEDGLLDLTFRPEGMRQADRNLLVAASHYVQPVGTFHGVVKASPQAEPRRVDGLLGVTEDHRSRW